MATSYSGKRMLKTLPSPYRVTGYPGVDPTFHDPAHSSLFRPYLWDSLQRLYTTEQGKDIKLLRAADDVADAIYGKALRVDGSVGDVIDHGFDLDANIGASWTLTYIFRCGWDQQPSTASRAFAFNVGGSSGPRLGYEENTGNVVADGWYGNTTAGPVSLGPYTLGWKPRRLVAVSLVSNDAVPTTELYVDGVLRATLNESIKANVTGTMKLRRDAAETGVTGKVDIEAYFAHNKVLTGTQVKDLHALFTTGLQEHSRIVRGFSAIGMAVAEVEGLAWAIDRFRNINQSTGGSLTNLGRDFGVLRRAGEADDPYRKRIKNRLLEYFSTTTPNDLLKVAASRGEFVVDDIAINLNQTSSGQDRHAYFEILLPPGSDPKIPDIDAAMKAAKAAGIQHAVGVSGSFAWDAEGSGWGVGSWQFVR